MTQRTCKKCADTKHLSEFGFSDKAKLYRRYTCKKCRNNWYHLNKKKYQSNELKRLYGISLQDKAETLMKQKGLCKICNKSLNKAYVDHCHKSNQVRGILCLQCNSGLGYFKDSIKSLISAIKYLEG